MAYGRRIRLATRIPGTLNQSPRVRFYWTCQCGQSGEGRRSPVVNRNEAVLHAQECRG